MSSPKKWQALQNIKFWVAGWQSELGSNTSSAFCKVSRQERRSCSNMDTVSAYRRAMQCAWLNSHQVCKKNKKLPLRVHFHYSFLLPHCLLSAVSLWVAGFFIAAVSRNSPKENINLAWMFTSGITGLVVHINNRELMHLSDLDGDQDYRNNL